MARPAGDSVVRVRSWTSDLAEASPIAARVTPPDTELPITMHQARHRIERTAARGSSGS